MKKRCLLAALVLLSLLAVPGSRALTGSTPVAPMDPMLQSALALADPGDEVVAIANLDQPATAADLTALGAVVGRLHAFEHLPMVVVIGTPAEIRDVARVASVRSLYWNEQQELHTNESQRLIHAQEAWDLGVTGKGVGIAILDSGVDGTHPDLADHLVANVKILGPEYVAQGRGAFQDIVLEDVPTSDTTSGHGTHVAGDAAGDGTASGGKYKGPAYDANLIGIGAGEGLSIYTALAGFDWAIAHQAEHNIRVINNSWGTSFRLMDPNHPVLRASRAAHGAGMAVVFSAGNRYEEMTISPYVAPWNITVAAGAKAGGLASFSSKGLEFDNLPTISDPGQTDFTGTSPALDGVGLYHPSVTGIGEDVRSARAPGTVVSALGAVSGDETLEPQEVPYYTHASGTSMSAPQVSGVIALAQQAFHEADAQGRWLSPDQVKSVIQLSAVPMESLKLWQQGYGLVHAPRTVELARSLAGKTASAIDAELGDAMTARNQAAAAQVAGSILNSYAWRRPTLDSVQSVAKHTFSIEVPSTADRVKALVSFPPTTQVNVASVDLYLFDAANKEVGRATASSTSSGVQILDVRFSSLAAPPTFGTWRLEARGDVSSNCFTGTVPRCVSGSPTETWVAAQVIDNGVAPGVPTFRPTGSMKLFFHNESAGVPAPPGAVKPGYRFDGGLVGGDLSTSGPDNPRAGFAGYAYTYAPGAGKPALFRSAPLASSVTLGQDVGLDLFLHNEPNAVGTGSIGYWLFEVTTGGERKLISSEELKTAFRAGVDGPMATSPRFALALPYTVSAGSRIELELKFSAATSSPMRFYYDSPVEPAALNLTTGVIE